MYHACHLKLWVCHLDHIVVVELADRVVRNVEWTDERAVGDAAAEAAQRRRRI